MKPEHDEGLISTTASSRGGVLSCKNGRGYLSINGLELPRTVVTAWTLAVVSTYRCRFVKKVYECEMATCY